MQQIYVHVDDDTKQIRSLLKKKKKFRTYISLLLMGLMQRYIPLLWLLVKTCLLSVPMCSFSLTLIEVGIAALEVTHRDRETNCFTKITTGFLAKSNSFLRALQNLTADSCTNID